MKKRLLSILLMCCMVLTLLPTTAFAEGSAEEPPVCSCETACTADNMNKECPVCGAENAIPQNCGQYIPVEDRTGENGSTERADDPNGPIELSAADQVQAMINGLPNAEEITEDNAEEVKAQLEAIDEAKEKLSDEEIDELDMTRYAEAAAALGALAAPMLLANDSPDEQFSLTPGGRYYFDLSAMNIPGTANGGNSDGAVSLPDTSLHYVPFTYAGTIEAYKLTSATATTEEYAQQNKYPHSLFVADYAVTHTVSWDDLNTKSLIFGKNYASGGVDYTLRAPSVGSNYTGSGNSERGVPQSNEWDTMLNKDSGYIQNWNEMYSWGQDTVSVDASLRAIRGYTSARYWSSTTATNSYPDVGFRPVLEVLNPDTLGPGGLKVVTLDLGGGKLGGSSEDIQIIVKNGESFTAPASDGLTRPAGDTGSSFMWLGSDGKLYEPGDNVSADVTRLTAQFDEQFTLTTGDTYWFDLSGVGIPGTANSSLPDTSLHYVPFTYAGTVDAYKLTSEMVTTEEYAQKNEYAHSLFVADYAVTHTVGWDNLDGASLIFGKGYAAGSVDYMLRAPSTGSDGTGSGNSRRGTPQSNEWDRILDKDDGYIKNCGEVLSWGQDTASFLSANRARRGNNSARNWSDWNATWSRPVIGFRPVLEVLNPDTLGTDGLKAVTLDLGGGKLGGSSDNIQIIVKNGESFTAPASDGLTRPDGNTGSYFKWRDSNGKLYAPGDNVPADVDKLTVLFDDSGSHTVTITTDALPDGKVGETYSQTLAADGTAPITWSISGGALPDGLKLDENTGGISGEPPAEGTATFTVKAENSGGSDTKELSITITKDAPAEYTVTVTTEGSGTASASHAKAVAGTEITLTAMPDTGYRFKEWEIISGGVAITNNKFTMPDGNVEVKAIFAMISQQTAPDPVNENTGIPSQPENSGTASASHTDSGTNNGAGAAPASPFSATPGTEPAPGIKPGAENTRRTTPKDSILLREWQDKRDTTTITGDQPAADEEAEEGNNPFTDVSEDDWFYDDVMFVYENGLMEGISSTQFGPYETQTRGRMAEILWRMEGSPAPKVKNSFADVEDGARYADAIAWITENDILSGYGKDRFGPGDPITWEQLAVMFYRYAQYKGYDISIKGSQKELKDMDSTMDDAGKAVLWAVSNGLIREEADVLSALQDPVSRAEIAAMLHRFIDKYKLVQGMTPNGQMGFIAPEETNPPQTDRSKVPGWIGISVCAALTGGFVLFMLWLRRRRRVM